MNSFAPSTDQPRSGVPNSRSAWGQKAGQPEHIAMKRLARGYFPALLAGCTLPPLVFISSLAPLNLTGVAVVTAWTTIAIMGILHVAHRMRGNLIIGNRKWNELQANAIDLERAYERLDRKYNLLYAEYLLQRGAVPLVAKRARGMVADLPSGVNGSATVVPFKTDGAA